MEIAVPYGGEVVAIFLRGRGFFENHSDFQVALNIVLSAPHGNIIEPCNVPIRNNGFGMVFKKLVGPELDVSYHRKPLFLDLKALHRRSTLKIKKAQPNRKHAPSRR